MERPRIGGIQLETREPAPRRGGGLMKGAAVVLVAAALLGGVAYFFGVGSSLKSLLRTATPEQKRNVAAELAKILTSQVELYKLQHNDALPDLRKYPNWE